ncbi:MAG: FeoB-associated Cys-rich membrane protein [Desulfobacteraceae bacterium]
MQTLVVLIAVILAGLGLVRHFVRQRQRVEQGGCGCSGCELASSCRSMNPADEGCSSPGETREEG